MCHEGIEERLQRTRGLRGDEEGERGEEAPGADPGAADAVVFRYI